MKFIFDTEDEKTRFCQFVKKLALMAENGTIQSEATESDLMSFDEFWAHCPNKADKKRSRKLYEKLSTTDRLACFYGMKTYKSSCGKDGRQNILMPSTFIHNERWDDLGEIDSETEKELELWTESLMHKVDSYYHVVEKFKGIEKTLE